MTAGAPATPVDGQPRVGVLDRLDTAAWIGILLTIGAGVVYWLSNRLFDASRGDFFYLADAFLHGRTWLDRPPRPPGRDHRGTATSSCRSRRSRRSP